MTRILIAAAFVIGLAIGVSLCKRKPVSPCPEYKVYGEKEVSELTEQVNKRKEHKAVKGLST